MLAKPRTKSKPTWLQKSLGMMLPFSIARSGTSLLRMGKAVQFARTEVIKSINTSQPTHRYPSGNRRGLDPSKPGDPPKRIHGDLVRSITTEVVTQSNRIIGRYGSTQNEKAKALEFGTSKMAARPFLRPPLHKNRNRITRILAG